MRSLFLIAAVIAATVLGGRAGAAAGPARRVAQAQPIQGQGTVAGLQVATDRAFLGVSRLLAQRTQRVAAKRTLQSTYTAQLAELDRLKQSKASWRRDRQIRAKKAESQDTAGRLSRVDAELRALDAQLKVQRQALVVAISRELGASGISPARRATLVKMRGDVMAALRPRARRIILPDDSLDELADPDELSEQIALIAQAEKELSQERQVLRQREDRYSRWAVLREQRERAGQMSDLEDDQVRRSTGRSGRAGREGGGSASGGDSAAEDDGDSASPGAGGGDSSPDDPGDASSPPPSGPDASFDVSSVVLADVVDSTTIDALKRAGRSSNPRARADAAKRARVQVEQRLTRLKKSRALIQNHLNKLRSQ